jgi:hypothetical protein
MKSHKFLIGCGITGVLGLGALFIGIILANSIPAAEQQIPVGISSNMVNISLPMNGATLPLNQPVSVYAQAFGDQPLQDLQLLVDGVQQPNGDSSPAGTKKMIVSWTWTPIKAGTYTLVARSTNAQNGQTGISNAVNINVLPPDQILQPLVLVATAEPLVIHDETGLTIPGIDPADGTPAPPPPGFNEQGGVDNPPTPSLEPANQEPPVEPSQQPGGNLIPIKFSLWAQNLTKGIFGVNLPAAPKLDGNAATCDAVLVAQDNSTDEIGFFLYRLAPGGQTFSRILTMDSKAGKAVFSYHDPALASGKYLYYISAFNSGGETASNIISITVDSPLCAAPNKGKFDVESIPIDFGKQVDNAYCYNSTNGMPWIRLPYGQNTFIYPVNGKFDLAPYWNSIHLPRLSPQKVTLNLECWGWIGNALVYLGSSSHTITYPYGGGGDPAGTLGEPPKYRIASPYNASITNDPSVCKDHVPPYPGVEQQCKDYMAANGGYLLVWTYNRFGECNPQAENCDADLQPADGFNIYTYQQGNPIPVQYSLHPLGKNFSYVPAMGNGEYFVRAYNDTVGESADSNHVLLQLNSEITINPTSVQTDRMTAWNYDGSVPHWEIQAGLSPDEMESGYAFTCLNNCSDGKYRDGWYYGTVKFDLPGNVSVQKARLDWDTEDYITSGPGENKVLEGCGVHLIAYNPWWYSNLNSSLWGVTHYDVSPPVLKAMMDGQPSIEFTFQAPWNLKPSVRWDRCLWQIHNLTLTLYK